MEELQDTGNLSFKEHGDKTDFLDGFTQVFGFGSGESGSSVSSPSTTITEPTGGVKPPEPEEGKEEKTDQNEQTETQDTEAEEQGENPDETATYSEEEGTEEAEETEEESTSEEDSTEESTEESDEGESSSGDNESDEAEIVDSFFDLFAQELGWDYDEKDKPNTISGLVDFMSDIMDKGSQPSFANEEIQQMNQYVANGGKLEDYLEAYSKDTNLSEVDVEDSIDNQKKVIREQLKQLGMSEDNIENKIQRYEDVGTLAEEAKESQELLKKYDERETEKLLKEQENQRKEREEQQQKFIDDVKGTIDSMKTVKGIPLTKKQKEDLKSYLFEVDSQGMTGYQKDYSKSYNNLIESAFFTMQGDDIVKQLQRKANTDATKNLKNKLNKSKTKRSKGQSSGGSAGSASQQSSLDTVRRLSKILSE